MKKIKKYIVYNLLLLSLVGCTLAPGSHLSTKGKRVVSTEDKNVNINQLVDVYSVGPKLIESLRSKTAFAQANSALEAEIKAFQYRVGIGDILNIIVWEHPELTIPAGSYRSATDSGTWVHADGTIYYPYVGKIHVAGKTVVQIRQEITQQLAKFISSPQVDVNVES